MVSNKSAGRNENTEICGVNERVYIFHIGIFIFQYRHDLIVSIFIL